MRILGLDLGARSIKAVELDSAFGRFEIHDYHEQPIEAGADGQPDFRGAVTRLMSSLSRQPDKIAVAAKPGTVTFRNLRIPTRGKKAVQAAVGFELEDELPFPTDQSIHDYSILGQGKQGTLVHVAVTMKAHVSSLIHFWNSCGVDPDLITTEAWAYRTLLNRITPQSIRPTLVVQLGQQRSVFYVHWNGHPAVAREVDWGGRDLTAAIAKKYDIPLDAAEKAKIDGFVIPSRGRQDATPEQVEFSETLIEPLHALTRDLHQAILTCKNSTKEPPEAIFLTGGSSLLPGLAAYLHENVGIPVRPLQGMAGTSVSGITYSDDSEALYQLALGLAMCFVGQERTAAINFRKAEFGKQARAHEFQLQSFRWILASGGAVLGSLLLSLAVQSQVYNSKLAEVDKQLKRNVTSFFGQISESAVRSYIASTTKLKTAVTQELDQQRQLNSLVTPDPNSPLDVLKDFSKSIPKDVVVDVTEFKVGASPAEPYSQNASRSISMSVLVSNPQIAERLAGLLGDRISGIQRGKTEEVTTPTGEKKWKISFSGNIAGAAPSGSGGTNSGK